MSSKIEQDGQLFFVYGTLKEGYWNHRLLSSSVYEGTTETEDEYYLVDVGCPIAYTADSLPHTLQAELYPVRGEVYRVYSDYVVALLDRLEGHPNVYTRTIVKLADGREAFMYLMNNYSNYSDIPCDVIDGAYQWY